MKKTLVTSIALATGIFCLTTAPSVFASSNDADMEILQKQVQELISLNQSSVT